MENVLIIGARTLVGRRLSAALMAAGWPETAIWHSSRQQTGGQGLVLDMSRPEAFAPDRVFSHVIVCTPVWLIGEALIVRLHELGMKRLVAFSSTSRLTKADSAEPAERDVVRQLAEGEARLEQTCHELGIDWTLLRPTLIYDEGLDENVSRIARLIRKLGVFPLYGRAQGLRQPVHARDLAAAAAAVLINPASYGKCYNLPGGETLSYRDMVRRIFKALKRPPLLLSLPEGLWRVGFGAFNLLRGGRLKGNLQMARRMGVDLCFDAEEARRDFGYAPGGFNPDFS
jgi:nucleoside-diphosphate-sugar epimerase